MRIDGIWLLCDDGIVRPIIPAEALASDGSWIRMRFLVDTGADRSVISADILDLLQLPPIPSSDGLKGAGGTVESVVVATEIRFSHGQGGKATFQGQFAACKHLETLEMSVLGRDILDVFVLIVDRQGDTIALIAHQHYYSIHQR